MGIHSESVNSDVIYYNAGLFVPDSSPATPAEIADIRSVPILEIPGDYDMSVIRFDVSTGLLPASIVPMDNPVPSLGANVPTKLWVTLFQAGIAYSTQVNIDVFALATYGFIYGIDDLLLRINTAFATSLAAIFAPGVASPPVLCYNSSTKLISMYVGSDYLAAGAPQIWVNSILFNYITTMPVQTFVGFGSANHMDFRIQVDSSLSIFLGPGPVYNNEPLLVNQLALVGAIKIPQSGIVLDSWSSIRSIYITTSSLPITAEQLPTNVLSTKQSTSSSSNSGNIVSDFLYSSDPTENPIVDRIKIVYLPTAEYRMISLNGGSAIKSIDLKFWYTDKNNISYPLFLPPGGYASVKILFRRKNK